MVSFNCRSIRNKIVSAITYLEDNDIDLCMLQETWLNKGDGSIIQEIKDHGYNIYTQHRHRGNTGGGVAIISKPHLIVRRSQAKHKFKSFEYISCTIHTVDKKFRIINIYRMGYTKNCPFTYKVFLEEFSTLMELNATLPGELIVTGDFNFHIEKSNEDKDAYEFLELMDSLNLIQHVSGETHVNGGTLDLILSTSLNLIKDITIDGDRLASDHNPILFTVKCKLKQATDYIQVQNRNYKNMDIGKFKRDLLEAFNPKHFQNLNAEHVLTLYLKVIERTLDKHCPMKTTRCKKRPSSLWYNNKLLEIKRSKRTLERRYKKTKSDSAKAEYVDMKHRYNRAMAITRQNYYRDKLDESNKDMKSMYKTLNKIMGTEKELVFPTHKDPQSIANEMTEFYANKILNIRNNIATINKSLNDDKVTTSKVFAPQRPLQSFTIFKELTIEDTKTLIKDMNSKSSCLDPMPTWLVKDCLDELLPILTCIINKSMKVSTFPATLKHATITPTLKNPNEDAEVFNNYRPISNTAFVSKLLEKAALSQINKHINSENLHASTQSGYRKYHSCETATFKVVDDMKRAIEKGQIVALILLDLTAAFDTVDHTILLKRLQESYAISGEALEWIKSYLMKRTFSVKINNVFGIKQKMLYGVPQGSLLGPLLFILYTKDMIEIAAQYGLSIHMYADDTQLYIAFQPLTDNFPNQGVEDKIEKCLGEIKKWMSLNFLKLNPEKTDLIFIGRKNKLNAFHEPDISQDNTQLMSSKVVKTLGVLLDPTLSMDNEINHKCSSAYYHLRNIGRLKRCLDEPRRIMLVQSLILSKLDYCNSILANAPAYRIKKLQRVLNASVRFIYDVGKREHITPYMKKAHFLPVTYRIKFKLCLLVYKALNGIAPQYISDMMTFSTPKLRNDRDSLILELPSRKENTLYYQMCMYWNALPLNIRRSDSMACFKKNLKTLYFNNAFLSNDNENETDLDDS